MAVAEKQQILHKVNTSNVIQTALYRPSHLEQKK